jgi:hypothetical protein
MCETSLYEFFLQSLGIAVLGFFVILLLGAIANGIENRNQKRNDGQH